MIGSITLDEIIETARRIGASDVHLAAGSMPLFRVNGVLGPVDDLLLESDDVEAIAAIFHEHATLGDGEVDFAFADRLHRRMRVHGYTANAGRRFAIRMLSDEIPTLDDLGVPDVLRDLASRRNAKGGLILVAGATGQGKTTLLAALLDHLNREAGLHIVTVEDPIEYLHRPRRAHITQREVGVDVPSFEAGIEAALRLDPDVVMIGELRRRDAIATALRAAETGHLVLATVHAGNAAGAVERIVDAFDEGKAAVRAQVAASLAGVLALRLIPRDDEPGRVLACEVLVATAAVRTLVRDEKSHQLRNQMLTGRREGMQTFEYALSQLVAAGRITAATARAYADVETEIAA